MRRPWTAVVSIEEIAAAGGVLDPRYWQQKLPGEDVPAMRKRQERERQVEHAQAHLARLGGLAGADPTCTCCHGSGVAWNAGLVPCPGCVTS